jgi:tetratricopeptide (TPR) repeat protein
VAQDLAQEATQRLGEDAEALLALGIVQETTGSVVDAGRRPNPDQTILTAGFDEMVSRNPVTGFSSGMPGRPTGRVPDTQRRMSQAGGPTSETRLRRAAETYRRALKARPDLAEARLRLGRTLALLNETRPATEELQAAAAAGDTDLVYLARLFLGDLKEQQGDYAGAADGYRSALSARPDSAVARLAIARAQQAKGDLVAAQAAVQALLLEPADDPQGDPWWRYRLRPLGRWAGELEEAR